MRILITGANGQLGKALQRKLSRYELLSKDLPELDVTDRSQVEEAVLDFQPNVVIHCAAYTNVEEAARNPILAYKVNGLGTQNVALACMRAGTDMLHVSTNEVFWGDDPEGYEEWMPVRPRNPYARSKAAAEFHVRSILTNHYIVRTAWLFAEGGRNFIHAILSAAHEGRPLRVVSDEIGNPTYAADLAEALDRLILSRQYGTYHFANEGPCSRLTFAREALRLSGLGHVAVTPILSSDYSRVSSPPLYSALKNVAGAAIGIRLRPWQEALSEYLGRT